MRRVRNRYFVCYDVSDQQRLARTHKKMLGYGDPVQYSVFSCELSRAELVLMVSDLEGILDLGEDRVLIIDTGEAGGRRSSAAVTTMGAQIRARREAAVVV